MRDQNPIMTSTDTTSSSEEDDFVLEPHSYCDLYVELNSKRRRSSESDDMDTLDQVDGLDGKVFVRFLSMRKVRFVCCYFSLVVTSCWSFF